MRVIALILRDHSSFSGDPPGSDLKEQRVVLAPLAEQRRIVAKVEELLAEVNRAKARLAKVQAILKRFRQSVLAAACSGELTREWREASGISDTTETVTIGSLLADIRYGTAKKCAPDPKKTPVLRIPNVVEGRVTLDDLKHAAFEAKEKATLALRSGDILMIRSNGSLGLVGRVALVPAEAAGFLYAGYLIRLRVDSKRVLPEYLALALAGPDVRHTIEMMARSTSGVNNINTDEIRSLEVPLPSLYEQAEAVRCVNALLAVCDAADARVVASLARAERLPQAILSKAFSGELVPTEAELARLEGREYEPAAVLLARVTEAQTAASKGQRGTTRRQQRVSA